MDEQLLGKVDSKIDLLAKDVRHQNELMARHIVDNEKEHSRLDGDNAALAEIIRADRDALTSKMDKLIEGFKDVAVLTAEVKIITKTLEDRRSEIKGLFKLQEKLSDEVDAKLKEFTRDTQANIFELNKSFEDIKTKVERTKGSFQALNWIVTIGLSIWLIISEIVKG